MMTRLPRGRPPLADWPRLKRDPPPVVGQLTLDVYDQDLWNALSADAIDREVPLALYVHEMLRTVAARSRRAVEWRREQDARDPDLVEIQRFLSESDSSRSKAS